MMKTSHHPPSRALSQDALEKRRKKAAQYFNTNKSVIWIANKFGVTRTAVYQWKKEWEREGGKGLKKGVYGRVSKLTPEQEKEVRKDILNGAKKCGYDTDFWTIKRIADHIKKKTSVTYEDRSLWHTLKRFGFSCQKPNRRSRERDEKAIATWLSTTWPAIKKGA